MFWTYIIYSENLNRYYIGQTNDPDARLKRHNGKSERYTKKYVPWKFVCTIEKQTRSEAVVLERKSKNLNREDLKKFILKYS
jgi:putative endonuclease